MCTQLSLPETFKMSDVPESLLVEDTKSYHLARLKEKFDAVLANPPKQVDISKRCSPKVFDDIIDHNSLQKALKAKNKRWDKKRKHKHDYKHRVWKYDFPLDAVNWKNARRSKSYSLEESYEDFYVDVDEGYWCVFDYDLGCYVSEEVDCKFIPCKQFPNEWDFLVEIGCEHLHRDFEWEKELLECGYYENTPDDEAFIKNIKLNKGEYHVKRKSK